MFRIKDIKAFGVSVPLAAPVKMAGVTIAEAENLIVRIEDGDGMIGWGEAASAPNMTGETPEGMVAAAKFVAGIIANAEIETPADIPPMLGDAIYGNASVKAAFEIALLDLAGKKTGTPVYELLGGKVRDRAAVITLIAGGSIDAEIDDAKRHADDGYIAFKVKVGIGDVETDITRAKAIRGALGNGARVSADANQGYGPDDALTFAAAAEAIGLDFFEQPVIASDLEAMCACAEASGVPVGADEGLHSIADIRRHHELGAAAGGSVKPIKLGGLFAVIEAAAIMDGLEMHVNLSGKVADTSIASAAIAHLAVSVAKVDWDVNVTNPYLAHDITADPVVIADGHVTAFDRPGLGVEPDEARLAQFTSIS